MEYHASARSPKLRLSVTEVMASLASMPANAASPVPEITPENLMGNEENINDFSMQSWSGGMTPEAMASLSSKAPQAQMLEDPGEYAVHLLLRC